MVSFTFGCPEAEVLRDLRQRNIHTTVTVTTVAEAREAAVRGAASLAVQGPEAGGHRGTWDLVAEPDQAPLLDLLSAVVAAVEVPVAAGGGMVDAAGVRSVLERGGVAAQVGTAYLLAHEAGTNPVHRAALTDPALARDGHDEGVHRPLGTRPGQPLHGRAPGCPRGLPPPAPRHRPAARRRRGRG